MTNLAYPSSFFQDLFDFRRDFDQIFNRMLSGWPVSSASGERNSLPAGGFVPAVESYIDKGGKTYHCRIALPGIDPKDVQIQAQGSTLTISGERKAVQTSQDLDYLHNEFWYGAFERTLTLPDGADADKVSASYHNGVLEVTAPIAASALPRRIEIKAAPAAKQIAA